MTATTPREHSRFLVTSRCLCFGPLHNIWYGASSPIQSFSTPQPERGGTIMTQKIKHNIASKNGTWVTYQLIDGRNHEVVAWFVAHSDVDPEVEINKILRVSGSPYEPDSGDKFNSSKTAAEGILVINRYDWDGWDDYGKKVIQDLEDEYEFGIDSITTQHSNSIGLVDYKYGEDQVMEWKDVTTNERQNSENGAWLYIPRAEYMFARFGFDEEHVAARSFLFFTESTVFPRTTFKGVSQTLRVDETPEERFLRHLREGDKYDGFEDLEMMLKFTAGCDELGEGTPGYIVFGGKPSESECLGPYEKKEHVLRLEDIEAIGKHSKALAFIDPLKDRVVSLLNDMILSYLEKYVIPVTSHTSTLAASEALFREHRSSKVRDIIDCRCHTYMNDPRKAAILDLKTTDVETRIKNFLKPRCGNHSLVNIPEFLAGICRAVGCLVAFLLEDATCTANDCKRPNIVPWDVRITTHKNPELRQFFRLSRIYWYGED